MFGHLSFKRTRPEHSHECTDGERVTVNELKAVYRINEALAEPAPAIIGIVDDVLTAGRHFRAMSDVLSARFPEAAITGLFIARRVFARDPLPGEF